MISGTSSERRSVATLRCCARREIARARGGRLLAPVVAVDGVDVEGSSDEPGGACELLLEGAVEVGVVGQGTQTTCPELPTSGGWLCSGGRAGL